MFISVIIPAYNCEKYIKRCIESIQCQNMEEIEVICIEDGSDDDTLCQLKKMAFKYNFIKLISNKTNKGQSYSRNLGIKKAKGEYILFIDADDYIETDSLYELYDKAKSNDLDVLYFEYKQEYEDDTVKEYYNPAMIIRKDDALDIITGQERFVRYCKAGTNNVMPVLALYRTDFLRNNNIYFYEGIFHEDDIFYINCILQAKRTSHLNSIIYNYYIHSNTTMTNCVNKEKRLYDLFIVVTELLELGEKYIKSEGCKIEYANYINIYRSVAKERYRDLIEEGYECKFEYSDIRTKCDYLYITKDIPRKAYSISLQDRIDEIKKYENLIVFGAGKIAGEVMLELHKNGIDRFHIAVSETSGDEYLYGNKARQINDYLNLKEEALVLVSVSRKYSDEVMKILDDLGFKNRLNLVRYK